MTSPGVCGLQLDVSTENPDWHNSRLTGPEDPRSALELELWQVDHQLDQLLQKRRTLRRAMNDRFCPVLQLPVEVSTEIFMHYLRKTDKRLTTPFELGRICQAWRDHVWSTPKLWSLVALDLHQHLNCGLLNEWLVRSSEQSLVIDLIWVLGDFEDLDRPSEAHEARLDLFENVMGVLARFTARWHVVKFRIPDYSETCSIVFNATKTKVFPRLTCISLIGFPLWEISAPQLDELHLNHDIYPRDCPLFQNVTQVFLAFVSPETLLNVLTITPLLKHCTIYGLGHGKFERTVVASHLDSLTVHLFGSSNLTEHIAAPTLRELSISMKSFGLPFSSVVSFAMRSSSTLQRLSLSGDTVWEDELFELLLSTPCLRELNLSFKNLTNEFIRLLSPSSSIDVHSSGYMLPMLQRLTYEGQPDIASVDIVPILLARWERSLEGKIAPLNFVHLRIMPGGDSMLILPALPQHPQRIAEGMYLVIEAMSMRTKT